MARLLPTGPAVLAVLALLAAPAAAQPVAEIVPTPPRPIAVEPGETAAPAPVGPEAVGAGPAFRLAAIELVGATALGEAELAPLWQGLIGAPVTYETLESVAEAVGARYRAEGYVLSQAVLPAQTVEDGVVRIEVIEGFVDRVRVEGGPPAAARAARRRFAPLEGARPLAIDELERAVLISRDQLGGRVETVLEPAPATFGAADMVVVLEPDPTTGFAALDNRGSRLYGDVSASAGLALHGLLGLTERIDLLAAGDPIEGRLGYGRLGLSLPVGALDGTRLDGAALAAFIDASSADPELARVGAPGLRVTSRERSAGVGLEVPFVRTRAASVLGRFGLDWRRSTGRTVFNGEAEATTDELVALEASMSWDRADRTGVTILELTGRQGLDIGPATIGRTGPGAPRAGFTRGTVRLARLQRLGDGLSLFAEAIGQVAGGILPDPERFGLGGASIGRGFAPGNTTGDGGYGLRLELRRQVAGPGAAGATELYAFGDHGRARDRSLARDGRRCEEVSSAGIGARIDLVPRITLTPELVRQLGGTASDARGGDLETRAFIGITARF